ncbi:hypothetical protein IWW50_006678 [Coemansia erecta]|nr:hypothetical protein GGF43_006857 [Coemansia sp. RSA 2618]KAJ2815902.1 hypothetical protein IWW50_006678 [Coemansia erecta]
MIPTPLLRLLRYSLYLTAIGLAALELIVDAVALAALNNFNVRGVRVDFSAHKGAAGYTMFVTLITLLFIPVLTFANVLSNRGVNAAAKLNHISHELSVASFFTVLWFIAGVTMAVYAGDGDCFGLSVCKKFKAATAFAWFPFFVFLLLTSVLVIIMLRIRANGGSMKTPAYEVDGDIESQPAAPPQHVDVDPYAQSPKGENSYYNSNPQIAMPAAPAA